MQRAAQCARRAGAADRRDVLRAAENVGARSHASCSAPANYRELSDDVLAACSTCSPGAILPPTSPTCARACPGIGREDRLSRAARRGARRARERRHDPGSRRLRRASRRGRPARRRARRGDGVRDAPGRRRSCSARAPGASKTITRDRVIVSPAPGEPGRLPFWRGDGPGRPIELGRALGAFVRGLGRRRSGDAARGGCAARLPLDDVAARNLVAYVHEQQEAHRHAADRSRDHRRALPRRARRLARVHPDAVRRARACAVGAGAAAHARHSAPASRCRLCTPTTASCCASPTSTSCRRSTHLFPIRTKSRNT